MKINFIKQILFLMLVTSFCGELNAQVWSKSFTAGGYDSNNKLLGGSEVLQLIGHKNMLFAAVGYWEDANNIWYGGSNRNIGWGQINRLDNPLANWQEDFFLGSSYLRPEVLKQIIFTKDPSGNALSSPDTFFYFRFFMRLIHDGRNTLWSSNGWSGRDRAFKWNCLVRIGNMIQYRRKQFESLN